MWWINKYKGSASEKIGKRIKFKFNHGLEYLEAGIFNRIAYILYKYFYDDFNESFDRYIEAVYINGEKFNINESKCIYTLGLKENDEIKVIIENKKK